MKMASSNILETGVRTDTMDSGLKKNRTLNVKLSLTQEKWYSRTIITLTSKNGQAIKFDSKDPNKV